MRRLTAVLIALTVFAFEAHADVPERARADQIWGATYIALVQELGGLWIADARTDVAQEHGLTDDELRLAFRYIRAYPADNLRIDQVLLRYPHYNRAAVRADFIRLQELGLVESTTANSWRATTEGAAVMRSWNKIAARHAAQFESAARPMADDIIKVLDKIIANAARIDDGGINESVKWRTTHEFRAPADAPLLLRIDQGIWDYVAFINDNAHYRIDRYFQLYPSPGRPTLSPLEKELFAAMRFGRNYDLERCATQPVWRVGESSCRNAFNSLIAHGWALMTDDGKYEQSPVSAELFNLIEALTDIRLYSTWANVTDEEYDQYMAAISGMADWVNSQRFEDTPEQE